MKFKEKCSNGVLTVRIKAGYYEHIDQMELRAFENNLPRGFLNPVEIRNNMAEYQGPVGITLQEYLKTPISKRTFFIIAAKAVAAMEQAQQRHFKLSSICQGTEHVYINISTREIYFIYLPLENSAGKGGFRSFFRDFVYSVIPREGEDSEFGLRFFNYINSREKLTFRDVKEYIADEDFQAVRAVRSYRREERKGEKNRKATALLPELQSKQRAGLLISEEEKRYTSVYPVLESTSSKLSGEVNKPVFRIGKDKAYADLFIGGNTAVSRNHADLITRDGRYYIRDLNSTNGTYVNNVRITGEETEISGGDILRFANEEFIFRK